MYRQHLKMVLLQDLESNRSGSEFVQRITSIPVVYLAWGLATEAYQAVKTSNIVLKVSLNTTEKAATFVSNSVLKNFEKQLRSIDHVACWGLETLQEIVPTARSKKEKFYQQTKDIYDDTVESGLKKYEVVKHMSTAKALQLFHQGSEKFAEFLVSPYGEVCEVVLDFALECGEMYVDHYLPPLGDERPEKLFGDRGREPVWKRAQLLRNRFRERLYKHSLLKVQMVKLRTRVLLIKIYQFNLYQYILEMSAAVPTVMFTSVLGVFSTLQDLLTYLAWYFNVHKDDCVV